MSATKSHLPLHSVSARAGRCTPENAGNKEPSDLFTSLIYGFPQESTWVQLAGSYTSQGRLGTPRCHRLHVIFKLAVARHQRCVDTKDTADIKGASTPKMHGCQRKCRKQRAICRFTAQALERTGVLQKMPATRAIWLVYVVDLWIPAKEYMDATRWLMHLAGTARHYLPFSLFS